MPKTPQVFWYDSDGNTLSDHTWTNVWDGESRLAATENTSAVPADARAKQTWSFDSEGRWIERVVYSWNGGTYGPQYTNRFLWDDKLLIAIFDENNGRAVSFLRGLDLSRSFEGAGGAGGLLAVNIVTNGAHFCAYDGNGNVMGLASTIAGSLSGTYECDPFGTPIRVTGSAGKANPLRFSSQFQDEVAKAVKYLYRDYRPFIGRWDSRDRIEERGGVNIYGFILNSPIQHFDVSGLETSSLPFIPPPTDGGSSASHPLSLCQLNGHTTYWECWLGIMSVELLHCCCYTCYPSVANALEPVFNTSAAPVMKFCSFAFLYVPGVSDDLGNSGPKPPNRRCRCAITVPMVGPSSVDECPTGSAPNVE